MKNKTLCVKEVLGTTRLELHAYVDTLTAHLKGYIGITLDFSGIESISEECARELFVTWVKNNPRVTVSVVKATDAVECVIHQVLKKH